MANSLFKTIGHNSIADAVYNEITNRTARYYHFFGKTATWSDEVNPSPILDSRDYDDSVRNEIIALKEIAPSDVTYVIPRINWQSGNIYDSYDAYSTEIQGLDIENGGTGYTAPVITLGEIVPVSTSVILGTQYFYSGKLYTVTTAGTTGATNIILLGIVGTAYTHGNAVLTCVGTQATVTATLGTGARSSTIIATTITNKGSGYLNTPTIHIFDPATPTLIATITVSRIVDINNTYKLESSNFYVYNATTNSIYVCIDNNGGATSTVAPYGTSSNIITTADNYQWKYMSTIQTGNKFLTSSYLPVYTTSKSQTAPTGSIVGVKVDNAGTGYLYASTELLGNQIVNVGEKYYYSGNVYTIYSTQVTASAISPSYYYIITSMGTTTDWNAIAGTVGATYQVGSVITAITSGSGDGLANALTPTAPFTLDTTPGNTTTLGGGVVVICDGQLTTISVAGNGTGAVLLPQITNGGVSGVTIANGGEKYSFANLTVSGTGTGASISASLLTASISNSTQSYSESNVYAGSLLNIKPISKGSSYVAGSTTVTIIGDGTGATATANLVSGRIVSFTITNHGSGYNWAMVTIDGVGYGASARVVLSPYGGLGRDPINQLFAKSLMFYSTIANNLNQNMSIVNDYRQVGILKNPLRYVDSYYLTSNFASGCWKISATSVITGIVIDDIITSSLNGVTFSYRVEAVSGSDILLIPFDSGIPTIGAQFSGTGGSFTVSTMIPPAIDKYSGDLMFIDNETAFLGTSAAVRTVLNF